jgi:TolB-like protein/tetratricopeptide (TPR) repeat protein
MAGKIRQMAQALCGKNQLRPSPTTQQQESIPTRQPTAHPLLTQAIFLSYASQDADAARRICEALRAAGLEVWFDQSELRGGDAWDASIRKQIKECALFIPIISSNTEAREEGYFRLEWKLAVDRSHLMADNKAFFFPAILGGVTEAEALVPDKFRERQWTHLNDDLAVKAFAERIAKLQSGSGVSGRNVSNTPQNGDSSSPAAPTAVALAKAGAQGSAASHEQASRATGRRRADNIRGGERDEKAIPSIAVLAFSNRSASSDDEYFSDGLADELLNVLSKIKGLRVAARTSAFSFKGKPDDIATIGKKLNVATILEGSVRKSGNRVRISVQLVKVDDGYHLWSETYDRTLDDIFAVQDDIAQSVVKELRTALLGESTTTLGAFVAEEIEASTRSRSASPEAQRLIMQSRFYREKRRPADIKRSITLAEEAVALDPNYAGAYASLSEALYYMSIYGVGSTGDSKIVIAYMRLARECADAALALDATLASPHVTLSWLACIGERDRATGVREAKLAEALAPDSAEIVRTLGYRLMEDGQLAEAEALLARAVQLDPLWILVRINYSRLALWNSQPQEALHRVREAIAIDESAWIAQWHLSSVLCDLGDYAGAAEASARSCELRGELEGARVFREQFAAGGWKGYSAAVVNAPQYVNARIQVVWAQIELGQIDDAFATLNAMVRHYDQHIVWIKQDPGLAPLRGDPRFAALLKRVGFTQ